MLSRRIAVIYCVTNTLNGKQYVGVTSKTSALRWKEHCWKALRNPATEFHYSLAKHGPEIFTVSDIASALSDPSAVERDVIQHLRPVYNMTNGGEFTQGKRVSPEVIEKLRIANTGKVRSDEYRKRMGEIQKNSYATNPHRMAESVKRLGEMRLLIDHDKRIAAIKKCASEGGCLIIELPNSKLSFRLLVIHLKLSGKLLEPRINL